MEKSDLILKQWRIETSNKIGLDRMAMFLYILTIVIFTIMYILIYSFLARTFNLHNSSFYNSISQICFFFSFQMVYTIVFIFMLEKLNILIDFLSKKIYFFRNKEYKKIEKELKKFD